MPEAQWPLRTRSWRLPWRNWRASSATGACSARLSCRARTEPEPSVRAVLGHFCFAYIHPYPDGNGRLARLIMNTMLASGGYPWTVVKIEDRQPYMDALEFASAGQSIEPFAAFIAERVRSAS